MHDVEHRTLASSSQLEALEVSLAAGQGIAWQRCPVADRMIVVVEGGGYVYRSRGRDEVRDEVGPGDVVLAARMAWHRVVAAPDRALEVVVVTHVPGDVEFRR